MHYKQKKNYFCFLNKTLSLTLNKYNIFLFKVTLITFIILWSDSSINFYQVSIWKKRYWQHLCQNIMYSGLFFIEIIYEILGEPVLSELLGTLLQLLIESAAVVVVTVEDVVVMVVEVAVESTGAWTPSSSLFWIARIASSHISRHFMCNTGKQIHMSMAG